MTGSNIGQRGWFAVGSPIGVGDDGCDGCRVYWYCAGSCRCDAGMGIGDVGVGPGVVRDSQVHAWARGIRVRVNYGGGNLLSAVEC